MIIIGLWFIVLESGLVKSKLIVSMVVEIESEMLLLVGEMLNFWESIGSIG